MTPSNTDRNDRAGLLAGLGRAMGSALIFAMPLMMTMEMWTLGYAMDRWRLLALMLVSLPLLMFLSHSSGFERTSGWREDVRDVGIAYGIGVLVSAALLGVFAVIGPGMPASEIVGKIGLQAVPAALGALLGRSQLGRSNESDEAADPPDDTYGGELVVMAIGALFLGLNIAPTQEMLVISYRMGPGLVLALVPLTLVIMHVFVYASEFKGGSELTPETPWWSAFLRFTIVGYVVALAVSFFLLWAFGRLDGHGMGPAIAVAVVLAFPSAVGAAAARLIL